MSVSSPILTALRSLSLATIAAITLLPMTAQASSHLTMSGSTGEYIYPFGSGRVGIPSDGTQQDHGGVPAVGAFNMVVTLGSDCSQGSVDHLVGFPVAMAEAAASNMPVRIFTPTQQNGTMDYRPDRLNLQVSAAGTVTQAYCG